MTTQKAPTPAPKPYAVKRKKRKRGAGRWIAALIVLLVAAGAFLLLQEYLIFTPDGVQLVLPQKGEDSTSEDRDEQPLPQISADAGPRVSIDAGELPPEGAGHLNGALLEIAGRSGEEIHSAAAALKAAGYQAAVVPVKPADRACVSREELETARAACDEAGLRLVAYLSCFRDDYTARENPSLALCDAEGNLFVDYSYSAWLDPYQEAAREKVLGFCRFAVSCGADELILDHLSFPHSGNVDIIVYPETVETPREVIAAFTLALRESCSLRMGAVLYGDDTFGEGASEEKGQDMSLFLSQFERIWAYAADENEAAGLYRQCTALSQDAAHAFGAIIGEHFATAGVLFP